MSALKLTPEQAAEAERLFQILRATSEGELRQIAELLASKPDRQLLGKTEFEVRDLVHKVGAKGVETALNERKKGGIRGPVGVAPRATSRASFSAGTTAPSSA